MQLFGDFDILSFVRISRLKEIRYVNRLDSKRAVSQIFSNNPQGSRLRTRPKNKWWDCVQAYINRRKIKNWQQSSNNRSDWKISILEGKGSRRTLVPYRKKKKKKIID